MSMEQTFVLGAVASALVFIFNWIAKLRGVAVKRVRLTVILFVVAVPLSLVFTPAAWPAFPALVGEFVADLPAILAWAGSALVVLTQVVGAATALYNVLLKQVLERVATSFADLG